jgi:hypothetical protein
VWLYLESRQDREITLHAKKAPTFVSDAMPGDIRATIAAMKKSPAASRAGERLEEFVGSGRLRLAEHYFWNGPRHFPDMPDELRAVIAEADLTLLKGDVNFRRLVEDRAWPFHTDLASLTDWFPGTFAVLRTLKSEVAADIPPELVRSVQGQDSAWLSNGRWSYVRLVPLRGNGNAPCP